MSLDASDYHIFGAVVIGLIVIAAFVVPNIRRDSQPVVPTAPYMLGQTATGFDLVVSNVHNQRYYSENAAYTVTYKTVQDCLAAAKQFPTEGIEYQKAVCVPSFDKRVSK